jgi:hypothetical protein
VYVEKLCSHDMFEAKLVGRSGATPSAGRPSKPCPRASITIYGWVRPKRAFTKNRFQYNWHWFWDYGNGDLGNQGIHETDIARLGLGVKYPTKRCATG